jgi:putative nucleotidyltransferase with HDIG domain
MGLLRKKSLRRTQLKKRIAADKFAFLKRVADIDIIISILIWLVFVLICMPVLSFQVSTTTDSASEIMLEQHYPNFVSLAVVVLLATFAVVLYIYNYQRRVIKNHLRIAMLAAVFIFLLFIAKLGFVLTSQTSWATGTAIAAAIILSIAYDRRFAIGVSLFYCLLASFIQPAQPNMNLFVISTAGALTCCFSLREIRTRIKLLEVGALAAVVVFVTALALLFIDRKESIGSVFEGSAYHAAAAFLVGMLIQSLLPVIEKNFRIATSMTLLDYSDANQPLLKRLAMEAPGTFSHSLLVGAIAEAAAEAIGRNGLLCRVGAYYHDIGKINKPGYFVENEMGSASRHKELSPAMSQLIIIGHVKDGTEMAKEYALPAVLRQFIETHHGTTLVEFFYNEAKKKKGDKQTEPSESEFRYTGPKPRTKEAAIVMLADAVEGAVRSLPEVTPTKIETVIHNMAMKRLQDGQFDECDLSLRELSQIEASMSKTLAAHYHSRIAYPKQSDEPALQQIDK